MESVMRNVARKVGEYVAVPCYLYQSHGIVIMLHAAVKPEGERQFTCSEHLTGQRICDGVTMQEALDKSIERLRVQSLTVAERVAEKAAVDGCANAPAPGG